MYEVPVLVVPVVPVLVVPVVISLKIDKLTVNWFML